ncbi:hypothetical protein EJD96_15650 [Herbaspirillum seropedicae]|uniref:hypothetical protein n=1 Tax=Herbaspirillum seropedicae TaxID=964 RepID=UPI001122FBCA|nr:hypothetical protein [Herbaspirillum seropedicae]QDD65491.1 hypothetical protein EJD96_15650 [Herbaspirillum seropedicae]
MVLSAVCSQRCAALYSTSERGERKKGRNDEQEKIAMAVKPRNEFDDQMAHEKRRQRTQALPA